MKFTLGFNHIQLCRLTFTTSSSDDAISPTSKSDKLHQDLDFHAHHTQSHKKKSVHNSLKGYAGIFTVILIKITSKEMMQSHFPFKHRSCLPFDESMLKLTCSQGVGSGKNLLPTNRMSRLFVKGIRIKEHLL